MKRVVPLLLLISGLVLFVVLDLGRFISLESLAHHRLELNDWVGGHALLAPAAYVLSYIVVVAFSLPVGLVMTMAGGFLFGAVAGTLYAVIGATLGATVLFLVAKSSLGDYLLGRIEGRLKQLQQGFAEDALSYLFVLRLIPLFPFFLVNLAPAFLGVSLRVYLIATFFGIMPAGFVYALAGSGIGSILDRGGTLSAAGILTPQIVGALAGLALLALIPVIYRRFRALRPTVGDKP